MPEGEEGGQGGQHQAVPHHPLTKVVRVPAKNFKCGLGITAIEKKRRFAETVKIQKNMYMAKKAPSVFKVIERGKCP